MKRKGFTLLELLLALTIFSIIVGAAITVFVNTQSTKQRVDLMTQAQQSARIAIDYVIRDLRAAGFNIDVDIDYVTPQRRVVYASPYEVVFNANLLPVEDTPDNPKEPRAMKVTASLDERPAHYYPSVEYQTGAETVVFTLDWNNDGIINDDDKNNSPASLTKNPDDYCLIKRVYGLYDSGLNFEYVLPPGSPYNWTNQQIVSIVAGPDRYPAQATGIPMFYYYYDDDENPTTPLKLYGDSNGDNSIDDSEAADMAPITDYNILNNIKIIMVKITGASQTAYKGKYITSSILTAVDISRSASTHVFVATGHVYIDENNDGEYQAGEPPIEGIKVRLSTGEIALTDADGLWRYALIPGSYIVSTTPQLGYRPTTSSSFDFDITNESRDFSTEEDYKKFFGMELTPIAKVAGIVFEDIDANGLWDSSTEPGIPNIQVATWNNSTKSLSSPTDSIGIFYLDVNATESLYIWVDQTDSFGPSNVDLNDQLGFTQGSPYLSVNSSSSVLAYLNEGDVGYIAFGMLRATGTKPTIRVIQPNGRELWHSGGSYDIEVFASSNDSGESIKKLIYYYSVDGGDNWRYIDEQSYPIPALDDTLFRYTWDIPDTVNGSQICLVKVICVDEGNWSVYDYSDDYFTIVSPAGYTYFFLTNEYVDSISDDTLYIYALDGSPLPRYLNTINSKTKGIVGDSIPNEKIFLSHKPFKTQLGRNAEWVTKKGMPYADTIFPGWWSFVAYGMTDDKEWVDFEKYFDIEVYKTDSFASCTERVLLFSTLNASTYDSLERIGSIENLESESELRIYIGHGFPISRSDRLYLKVFYQGIFFNLSGIFGSMSPKIWMTFGETRGTKLTLPTPPKK